MRRYGSSDFCPTQRAPDAGQASPPRRGFSTFGRVLTVSFSRQYRPAPVTQTFNPRQIALQLKITMNIEQYNYNELCYYTLAQDNSSFIHQHVVDAFAAQTADENDKPIRLTFALVGLYLNVEKKFNGKQVQLAHMKLGQVKKHWPIFSLPKDRGAVTVTNVIATPAGHERDEMIHRWCVSVWGAYCENRQAVSSLLSKHKII
jgi:hypothetical protein